MKLHEYLGVLSSILMKIVMFELVLHVHSDFYFWFESCTSCLSKMCAEPRNLSSPHTLNKHFVTSHLSSHYFEQIWLKHLTTDSEITDNFDYLNAKYWWFWSLLLTQACFKWEVLSHGTNIRRNSQHYFFLHCKNLTYSLNYQDSRLHVFADKAVSFNMLEI